MMAEKIPYVPHPEFKQKHDAAQQDFDAGGPGDLSFRLDMPLEELFERVRQILKSTDKHDFEADYWSPMRSESHKLMSELWRRLLEHCEQELGPPEVPDDEDQE